MAIRRAFLWSMIVSLSLAALLGVAALIFGSNSNIMEKVFVTTLLWGGFSIICLMQAVTLEKRRLVAFMWIGLVCCALAFAAWALLIWGESIMSNDLAETLARSGGTVTLLAIPLAPAGLIAIPRLHNRLTRFLRGFTYASIAAFAALFILMIWIEPHLDWRQEEIAWRAVGVFGILAGAGVVLVPVFWKMQGLTRHEDGAVARRLPVELTCPRCGRSQKITSGRGKCAICGLRINIEIEEPRCACGYLLYQLTGDRCPECGRAIDENDRWAAQAPAGAPVESHGD